jgi:hypothetical protein
MIKAIETSYAGCRFRSRLEARWAVFFDRMNIGWQYEPQGFVINGHPYLPDFRLGNGTWIEVKGDDAALDHQQLLAAAQQLPPWCNVVSGEPSLMILGPIPHPPKFGDLGWLGFACNGRDLSRHAFGFGYGAPWLCGVHNPDASWLTPVTDVAQDFPAARAAYTAARSARFEHGQHGA